jgi:phage terminase large subunit GpA-like protein
LLFTETKTMKVKGCPTWMSADLWQSVVDGMSGGRVGVGVVFTKAERRRLKKRKQIKPSEWSEKHRVLVKSVLPGTWKNSVTPYLVGIMDAGARPFVREVITCKAPQTGVSECINNYIGSRVDMAPGDWLCTYPDEATTKTNFKDRLIPMFKNSVRLRSLLTGKEKDLSDSRINLQHMTIYGAWASSVSTMANKPCRYANSDEIDKPGFRSASKEASALDLIDKRLNTYRDISKHFKTSTPSVTTGLIWRELTENTDVIFDYHARCPFCSQDQLMSMDHIKWDGGGDADSKGIRSKKLAWYECKHCGGRWDDNIRNMAVRDGRWIAREAGIALDTFLDRFRPARVGFHLPAWISYFVSLSECAGAFIDGLKGKEKLKDFRNSFEALPWEEYEVLIQTDQADVLKCKAELPPQTVPQEAVALTCGIDMQKYGFPYVVRAWARDWTSWLIDYGTLPTFRDVANLLFGASYPVHGGGRDMMIWRAGLDTGGGKYKKDISSTEEAYLWLQDQMMTSVFCRVFGIKGSSHPLPTKLRLGGVINKTPSGKPLRMGMKLVFMDTDKLKDLFHQRMGKAKDQEPGGAYVHQETGLDYARQVTAERKQVNEKGVETWELCGTHDNHYLDAEAIAASMADWEMPGGGVNLLAEPVYGPVVREKKQQKKTVNPFTGGSSYWG